MTAHLPLLMLDADQVRDQLDYPGCMGAVKAAMIALSAGQTRQLLRSMIQIGDRGVFALMPGALGEDDMFGAKLISVFNDPASPGRRQHRGLVVLFEPEIGAPVCVADAEEITLIRTAAMTAVATDALARPDARVLTLYGNGAQAHSHVAAISLIRNLQEIRIWGRSPEKAAKCAAEIEAQFGIATHAIPDGREAAKGADILCTITNAHQPVLLGDWVEPGAHVNLVGSSGPGPVEVDDALVVASRFVADSRASITAQGAEFIIARDKGLIDETHIAAEIGEVLSGTLPGRQRPDQITLFKSIGHAMQDLASAAYLYRKNRT